MGPGAISVSAPFVSTCFNPSETHTEPIVPCFAAWSHNKPTMSKPGIFAQCEKSETGGVLTPLPPRSPRSPSLKKGDQHSHWLRLRSSHSPRVGDFPKVFQLGDTWSCPCLHGCDHVTKTYSRSVPYHLISWLKTKTMNSIIAILKVIQNHIKSYHVFANLNSDFGISGFKCPLFFGEFWCHGLHELRKGTGARRRERNGSQDWSHFWDLNVGYHGISWDIPSGKLT